jgi:hypothetical protein
VDWSISSHLAHDDRMAAWFRAGIPAQLSVLAAAASFIVGAAINIVTWWATQPVGASGAASLLSVVRYFVKLLLTALFPVMWVGASVTALRHLQVVPTSQHYILAAFGALLQAYQIGQYSNKWPARNSPGSGRS